MGASTRNIASLDYIRLINQINSDIGQKEIPAENLHQLYLMLKSAHKVKSDHIPHDIVTMNSNVVIRYVQSGETKTVRIVYPGSQETPEQGQESITAYNPLAISILGLKEHDVCFSRMGETEEPVMIDKILFQPEAHRLFNL